MRTSLGEIRGVGAITRAGAAEMYLGVPFAALADGPGRYRSARQATPWRGVRNATNFGPAVPQNPDPEQAFVNPQILQQAEAHGLNLNVWTPASDGGRRPVMVWIHGGGYIGGSNAAMATVGAELAAAMDVVVIAANYRLGALGFLALDHLLGVDYEDAANLGVLDQIMALRWVRDNAGAFGGDPGSVTIFGESAGGAMVCSLLGSPAATGLFHRAVVQSGTAERARTTTDAQGVTAEVLAALGVAEGDAERLLSIGVGDILRAQAVVVGEHARRTIGVALPFQPTFGGRVLPCLPVDAVRAGVNSGVDLLAGTNLNDGSFVVAPLISGAAGDITALARSLAAAWLGSEAHDRYTDALSLGLRRAITDVEVLESIVTDRLYRQPTNRLLDARLEGATGKTFAYLFAWQKSGQRGGWGASHALELPFVFRTLHDEECRGRIGGSPPGELSEWMSGAWTSFARCGTPYACGLPEWPEYSSPDRMTMVFDSRPGLQSDPLGDLRRLWREGR